MNREYTESELIEEIRRVDAMFDGPVSKREWKEADTEISYAAIVRRFGSWNDGKEAAGVEKNHSTRERPSIDWRRRKDRLQQIKEHTPCNRCGENYSSYVMDYHHANGEKVRHLSSMYSYSWQNIKRELNKCEIVCANCHRIIEHEN